MCLKSNPKIYHLVWRIQFTPVFLSGESMDRGVWQATVYGTANNWT